MLLRCPACGLVRQANGDRPARYDERYYASQRSKGGYANYFRDAEINRRTFSARLDRIEARRGRRGRLLDVGCALGDFVLEARRRGWDAEGLEISAYAVEVARSRGASARLGTLEGGSVEADAYDVVTLYDTLEHTADPVAMLRGARRALSPGGTLHVVTPNVDGLLSRALGRRWYHYKTDEHLVYFGPRTLERAVTAAGLAWHGWRPTGSYVTLTYVLDRLRAYSAVFSAAARMAAAARLGAFVFYLHVGELEAWAGREA